MLLSTAEVKNYKDALHVSTNILTDRLTSCFSIVYLSSSIAVAIDRSITHDLAQSCAHILTYSHTHTICTCLGRMHSQFVAPRGHVHAMFPLFLDHFTDIHKLATSLEQQNVQCMHGEQSGSLGVCVRKQATASLSECGTGFDPLANCRHGRTRYTGHRVYVGSERLEPPHGRIANSLRPGLLGSHLLHPIIQDCLYCLT
jgi:hypothetical protein